ncbi:hypothetical protein LZ30DRAFT_459917 [Colletotrichum cereale]|nr:hypothetical protein LZ30DRAFT_459917 [Colletotrichum cereale]
MSANQDAQHSGCVAAGRERSSPQRLLNQQLTYMKLRDVCVRLECDFDAFRSVLYQDPSVRIQFTTVIARYTNDFPVTPSASSSSSSSSSPYTEDDSGEIALPIGIDSSQVLQDPTAGLPAASTRGQREDSSQSLSSERGFTSEASSSPSTDCTSDILSPESSLTEMAKLDVVLPDERVNRKRRLETFDARPSRRKKDSKEQRLPGIIAKMENIASPNTIVRLWSSCRASRNGITSLGGYRQVLPVKPETHLDGTSVLERLDILREQSAHAGSNVHFSTAIGRFHHVQMVHLYQRAKSLDQSAKNVTECGPNGAPLSLVDQFAKKLFPNKAAATLQSIPKATKRNPLKSAFNRWLTLGKRLAILVSRYGCGILLLLPVNLVDEKSVLPAPRQIPC